MIRRIVWTGIVATSVAAVLVIIHAIDIPRAVVLIAVAYAVSLTLGLADAVDEPWPDAPRQYRDGGRSGVSELAWAAFTRDGQVTERVLRRVRFIAARRLAEHGVLWDARLGTGTEGWGHDDGDAAQHRAQAAELLGPDLLTALSTARAASPRALDTWFRALDRLVEAPDDARNVR